ncbi:MAG: hypothetical protein HY326_09490, partial [Chloroflexi bacterium]|nr:hypothetical protein [Chloroflexota bacterium]
MRAKPSWQALFHGPAAGLTLLLFFLASTAAYAETPSPLSSRTLDFLTPGGCALRGDVNSDGLVNYYDVRATAAHWHSTLQADRNLYDIVSSGRIDVTDIVKLFTLFNGKCPNDPMGVQMFGEYQTTEGRAKAVQGNLRWARLYLFSWNGMESADGTPGDWAWTDYKVQQAQQDGLRVIATIQGNPDWAATTSCGPIDKVPLSRYANFITRLVKRYGGNGGPDTMPGLTNPIKYWELGNEPDWEMVQGAPGACFGGNVNAATNPASDAIEYADMLKTVYTAVKGADPTAQIVFGSIAYDYSENLHFSMDFPDKVLQRLSADPNVVANNCYFDVLGFHQYDAYRVNWDGPRPFNQGLLAKVNAINHVLAGYSECANKPLMISEIGLQIGNTGQPDDPTLVELQARHMARMYFQVHASSVPVAIWYTLADQNESFKFGLFPANSTTGRPAYFVVRNLTELMKGYTFDQQIDIGG